MASKSWILSDALWERLEPYLPLPQRDGEREYLRRPGAGRKRADDRLILSGIFYVLRTGCHWNAVPRQFGAASTIHRRFQEWSRAGFFEMLWEAGLAEYDELQGIAWRWQAVDGAMTKAPLGGEATGPNPTDRGKKRRQAAFAGGRRWHPVVPVGERRQRP